MAKILLDFILQRIKQLLASQPDIVVNDKKQKTRLVTVVAIPADRNIRKKEQVWSLPPGRPI